MTRRVRYVIAYDVADDGNRGRLARFLLDYGVRVQKSVFEADLNGRELQEVLRQAPKYVDGQDSMRVYPLCTACVRGIRSIGKELPALQSSAEIV